MGAPFTNKHRHFVQLMLNNGQVTLTNALAFLEDMSPEQSSMAHLKSLIIEINREIGDHSFKIVSSTCEVTGLQVLLWLNTKNDEISRLQLGNTATELEYFHAILQEIITSEEHRVMYPRAINISSTLTATLSRENGEKALTKWIKGGYYVKKNEHVYLGSRTILEYTTYLRTNTENCSCDLCSELVFVGQICASCYKTFHSYCMEKYLQNQNACPSCKSQWQEPQMNGDVDLEESQMSDE